MLCLKLDLYPRRPLLNLSVPKNSFVRLPTGRPGLNLRTFDHEVQQYGQFFSDHPWQVYGTGTFRRRDTIAGAERMFRQFTCRLKQRQKGALVAFIGVLERRTSGLGMAAIPSHWHYLMAVPPIHEKALVQNAAGIWQDKFGEAHVVPYDSDRSCAYYMAKLAGGSGFEYVVGELDRLTRVGGDDYFERFKSDPYVPDHAKGLTHGQTLRILP